MGVLSDMDDWLDDARAMFRKSEAVSCDDAFEDGREARWAGDPRDGSPYKWGTDQHVRWLVGWDTVNAQIRQAT